MLTTMLLALAFGSWGAGPCVAVAAPRQATRTTHEWVGVPGRPDEFALMQNGRQIGSYSQNRGLYRPYDRRTDAWGEPCEPPVAPPATRKAACGCKCAACECEVGPDGVCPCPGNGKRCHDGCGCVLSVETGTTNFGIDQSKLTTGKEVVTISGREVTKADGLRAVGKPGGTIPDDAGKPWIIHVGDPKTGERLEADLRADPALTPWRDKFRTQVYEPGDEMTKDRDGKVMYTPGVWVVAADRKALGRMPAYTTPAVFAEGLRRLGPDWDPAKVPDLSKPTDPLPSLPNLTKVPVWQVAAGLSVAGVLFFVGRWLLRAVPLLLPLLTKSSQQPTPPVTPAPAPQPVARRPSKEALEAARQLMEGRK